MRDAEINEIIFNVLISRIRGESHCTKSVKANTIKKLIKATKNIFSKEESLLNLTEDNGKFVVVGDIHGNVDDLIQVFQTFGYPPNQKYLFLGDYIDRGHNSVEVLLLLYSLKVKYSNSIYLLRGNHETKNVSSSYGFKKECIENFTERIFKLFIESFRFLPIAAILNDSIFCVHGGLSPTTNLLDKIEDIAKPIEGSSKIVSDILWSDPSADIETFLKSPRGSGYLFSSQDVDKFLRDNNLQMIIRAHEFCQNGANCTVDRCLTIFSAIDYQGKSNQAAVAIVKNSDVETCILKDNPIIKARKLIIIPDWIFSENIITEPINNDVSLLSDFLTEDIPVLI